MFPRIRRWRHRFVSLCVSGFLLAGGCASIASSPPKVLSVSHSDLGQAVVRVYYDDVEQIRSLTEFDLWEQADGERRFVLVLVDTAELEQIQAMGFRTEIDVERTEDFHRPPVIDPRQVTNIPGFPCYRTVEEMYATGQGLALAHPNLATWTSYGESWERENGFGGWDLFVLRLTNSGVPGPKPKMIATCSIHAREYAPAELCTRFAEQLVEGYGSDADSTWLLDSHEVHLVLTANPDGRKKAETGLSWRKNTNQDYCGATSNDRGADLNRNFDYEWGCCGGSSGDECDTLYRGPAAASEPETQAVQAYLAAQFPDQRDDALNSPAPDDATGVYLDIHASGRLVLWPWGFAGAAPNDTALTTLGRKLAFFNAHTPKQVYELYPTDGTTVDFAYGRLGVAAYVYELGNSFFQDCSTFESGILPTNLRSLEYAAKVARTPYLTAAGPDSLNLRVTPALADAGTTVTVTATIDDTRYEHRNGAEPAQAIAGAELFVNLPPWDAEGPIAQPMSAADGSYDTIVEQVTASLDTTGLDGGRHTVYVRGRDADGNRGVVGAFFFYIADGTEGSVSGVVTDSATAAPLVATVSVVALGLEVTTGPETGSYELALPAGEWSVTASAPLHLTQTHQVEIVASSSVVQDFVLDPVPPILLVDDDDNSPDVRNAHTAALDALGVSYWIWDTEDSDDEPTALDLSPYETVLWFTGDSTGGTSGPGPAGEAGLAEWLGAGGCLLIDSEEYYYDRGLTSFMTTYLGVGAATSDVNQTTVTGQGNVFGGLGPWQLDFPYSNWTDRVNPDGSGSVAFLGNNGNAAVIKDTGLYRTSFWGFGLETVPTAADRQSAMFAFLDWCGNMEQADTDGDGTTNGEDCAPLDGDVWAPPGPARNLRITRGLLGNISWWAPNAPGADEWAYDLLRDESGDSFDDAECFVTNTTYATTTDTSFPDPGELVRYLVRTRNGCGETLGVGPDGNPREGPICP